MITVPQNILTEIKPEIPCLAMRARETAAALSISERTLWELTNRNEVPHIRLGKIILYPVDALREWLKTEVAKTEITAVDDHK